MYYLALSIGFLGSLHCVGMCGPLALMVNRFDHSRISMIGRALEYNVGRVICYTLLGLVFSSISSIVIIGDLQQIISILMGVLLILVFLVSISTKFKSTGNRMLADFQRVINKLYLKTQALFTAQRPFVTGLINGLLPCGLVYLAIAGSLSMGSVIDSVFFMMLFGIGTIPALLFLIVGVRFNRLRLKINISSLYKYLYLCFGLFLIYRGAFVDMPIALDFYEAIKNPIMCH